MSGAVVHNPKDAASRFIGDRRVQRGRRRRTVGRNGRRRGQLVGLEFRSPPTRQQFHVRPAGGFAAPTPLRGLQAQRWDLSQLAEAVLLEGKACRSNLGFGPAKLWSWTESSRDRTSSAYYNIYCGYCGRIPPEQMDKSRIRIAAEQTGCLIATLFFTVPVFLSWLRFKGEHADLYKLAQNLFLSPQISFSFPH